MLFFAKLQKKIFFFAKVVSTPLRGYYEGYTQGYPHCDNQFQLKISKHIKKHVHGFLLSRSHICWHHALRTALAPGMGETGVGAGAGACAGVLAAEVVAFVGDVDGEVSGTALPGSGVVR